MHKIRVRGTLPLQRVARTFAAHGTAATCFLKTLGKLTAALLLASGTVPAMAQGVLQCVPYAREVSGINIHGNARSWWDQAAGTYQRGQQPRVGAVLAFRATSAMPYGHVAVVSQIVDQRHLLLDHANWSGPGKIEHAALVEDVSETGDWSSVRVWYAPSASLGTRTNPTYGFIYAAAPTEATEQTSLARSEVQDATANPFGVDHG